MCLKIRKEIEKWRLFVKSVANSNCYVYGMQLIVTKTELSNFYGNSEETNINHSCMQRISTALGVVNLILETF